MHGAGNDFVVLDGIREVLPADLSKLARQLCRRPFGIGADQMLVVKSGNKTPFFMEIYNPDGSRVEMCGNGVRSFVHYLKVTGHISSDAVEVETLLRVVRPEILPNHEARSVNEIWVRVDMGEPVLDLPKIPVRGFTSNLNQKIDLDSPERFPRDPASVLVNVVSMGNPHAVIFVEDVANFPVLRVGPAVESHEVFPQRTNVEFVEIENRSRLLQRTWERGAGETHACGSGACATVVAGVLADQCGRQATVVLKGGEIEIDWDKNSNHVFQTGPSELVFWGEMNWDPGS